MMSAREVLAAAVVDPDVWRAHPDYCAVLVAVDGVRGGPTDERSEAALAAAESAAVALLDGDAPESLSEVLRWREAYLSFGVKPRVARSSVEALLRRCAAGLPRVDLLTDLYNAVSVTHLVPIGGEDLDGYDGAPRLVIADGTETFETTADGSPVVDRAEPGEVVWRDDAGVTCRRWNWRQCTRTRLTTSTTRALFIVDGLGEDAEERATATADALVAALLAACPGATVDRRLISAGGLRA